MAASGMPRLLLALLLMRQAAADNICASSDNADTNSALECKYLSPCTADVVPAEPAGYFIECETMPCDDDQDIMWVWLGKRRNKCHAS